MVCIPNHSRHRETAYLLSFLIKMDIVPDIVNLCELFEALPIKKA